jgi:hypothetical protein
VRQTISAPTTQIEREAELNSFDPAIRASALSTLLSQQPDTASSQKPLLDAVNMHAHTFYSFNAYGHSPTSLVWLARKERFAAVGSVDFDVLDAVDEFLDACELASVRGSSAIETRVFIPEFATREISSPGEPGVAYHMGIGFTSSAASSVAAGILEDIRRRASQRNRELILRVNAHLAPVTIDYDRDVLPLTPAGNATERHILVAYTHAVDQSGVDTVDFWARKLDAKKEQIAQVITDKPKLHNLIRSKLMKRGGIGYVQPGSSTFPSVDEFHQFVLGCNALPCATWLDGTSSGEQAIEELLNLGISKGVVALNIIPDRNWNIADAAQKRIKLQNLYDVVVLAGKLNLPLNVGTEMNAYGNKLIDDFDAPELARVRKPFLDGAYFIYGHTMMQRAIGLGYQSDWAKSYLTTRSERNAFYTMIGRQVIPGKTGIAQLRAFSDRMKPTEITRKLGG